MATKSRIDVEVKDSETEIIESTATVTSEERRFCVGNKDRAITITAWGSNDNQNWDEVQSKNIGPNTYDTIILGPNHYWHVKLTGKTTSTGKTGAVDAFLIYTEP